MYVKQFNSDWCKKIVLSVCALFLFSGAIWAQNITVTGKVTDKKGETLPGVFVMVDGTRTGASTLGNGNFTISAPSNGKLVFSSLGFKTLIVEIAGRTTINVTLDEDAISLEDVVVVGYGVQKKESLTAAVSTVDTKVLEARPIPDVGRGLQGVTPGLSIVNFSGEVGSDPRIRIRGQIASIQGGATPLILLDNVEIPSIQLVNPDDIESISILKDASSASIYGAKASFGVILITTKKGAKTDRVSVTYSASLQFQNLAKKMEMASVDAIDYAVTAFERFGGTVAGAFWYYTREGLEKTRNWNAKYSGVIKKNDPFVYGRDWYVDAYGRKIGMRKFDPYDYMIREWAPTQDHRVSVNGKSGKTDFNISAAYLDQSGMIKPAKDDSFQRYNGAVSVGTEVTKWLKVNGKVLYSKRQKNYGYTNLPGNADPWLYLYRWNSFYPMVNADNGDPIRSPAYEFSAANTAKMIWNYMSATGGLVITPVKDWTIKLDYTHSNQEYIQTRPGTRFYAQDSWVSPLLVKDEKGNQVYVNDNGDVVSSTTPGAMPKYTLPLSYYGGNPGSGIDYIRQQHGNYMWNTLNVNSTYNLTIANNHQATFLLGADRTSYDFTDVWGQTTMLGDLQNPQFDLASGTQTASGNHAWDSQVGFYGRLNYSFKEKYLVEGTLRYGGSSKFPKHLKWRYFPAASAAWRVTEEPWMNWAKPVLSSLKIRGSWGTVGDQSVSNNLYVPTLGGSNSSWLNGTQRLYQFGTPSSVSFDITWQDIETRGLGIDASFFKGRLSATFDLYRRDTKNMIIPMEGIPFTFGVGAPQGNYGSLKTTGFEFQLNFNHRFKNGLGINVVGTLADSQTFITKIGSNTTITLGQLGSTRWYEGMRYGDIFGYTTDRLYQREDFVFANPNDKLPIKIKVTAPNGTTYDAYQLSDPNGAYQVRLQGGNFLFGPGDVKFKDLNGDGFIWQGNMNIKEMESGDIGIIGNSTPRYEYSLRVGTDYKGFDFSVFFQGVGSRQIWGDGMLAIPGYNSGDGAMPQAFAGNFWREDRTDAFYPYPVNCGGSNNTLNMVIQSRYLLNMAYFRIKNITLGYTLPQNLSRKINISKLRVYVALENFITFDHLGTIPIDPEEIQGASMWTTGTYNLDRTGMGVPPYKVASFGLTLNF